MKISKSTIATLLLLLLAAGCDKEGKFDLNKGDEMKSHNNEKPVDPSVRDKFLVDKIYDYHHNLLIEYIYDDNNRLSKSIFTISLRFISVCKFPSSATENNPSPPFQPV